MNAKPSSSSTTTNSGRLGFNWKDASARPWRETALPLRSVRDGWNGAGGLGYHPDLPDRRDVTLRSDDPDARRAITAMLEGIRERNRVRKTDTPISYLLDEIAVPEGTVHDLRETNYFSPVEQQGNLGSCTAHAVIGLVEYLLRAGSDSKEDMSRRFLYRTTRRLLGWTGDQGAYLRTTIKAMVVFGVPPEKLWPYDIVAFDEEPDAFLYSYAQTFKATVYVRLDDYEQQTETTLEVMQRTLLDGFPIAFGFPVYDSIDQAGRDNGYLIPFPAPRDELLGGHAVLAVGFDDERQAFIIRNSWGPEWGDFGYGYLPYKYVTAGLAVDCWTIFNKNWLNMDRFE